MNPEQVAYFLNILTRFLWLGNWLFLAIAFIECIPIIGGVFPGGTLTFFGGVLAAQGYFNVTDVIIFATLGALLGDTSSYLFGRWGGNWVRRKKILKEETIIKSEKFFKKYGAPSIFWVRFSGSTWATISFIAGSARVKPRVFFFWNFLGTIGWALTRVLLGYFSGNIIAVIIHKWTNRLGLIILISAIVIFFYWLIRKHHQNIGRWYIKASKSFSEKLFSLALFKKISARYPVIREFFKTKISQEKILGGFIGLIILIILYILVLVLDLI
jgi:undecaprenyl-diphosphatase